jgi:phenylacetaldehyde dehydrogenase
MKPATSVAEFADLRSTVRDFIAKPKRLYIDGKWIEAASGKTFSTIDPATEQVICEVAEGDREDVDRAAKAAHKAFYEGEWSRTSRSGLRGRFPLVRRRAHL